MNVNIRVFSSDYSELLNTSIHANFMINVCVLDFQSINLKAPEICSSKSSCNIYLFASTRFILAAWQIPPCNGEKMRRNRQNTLIALIFFHRRRRRCDKEICHISKLLPIAPFLLRHLGTRTSNVEIALTLRGRSHSGQVLREHRWASRKR